MMNCTNLKQRKDIPSLPLEKKGFEEQLNLHANNKIVKKVIVAKVENKPAWLVNSGPIHVERDEYLSPVEEEDSAPQRLIMGKQQCNQQ